MSYKTFYCNQRLLLDNWDFYDEVNWMLTHLLSIDDTKTIDEKLDFYFKHRHVRDEDEQRWFSVTSDSRFSDDYEEYEQEKLEYELLMEDYFDDFDGECNPYMAYPESFEYNSFFEEYGHKWDYKKDEHRREDFERRSARAKKMKMNLREIEEVVLYKSDFKAIENAKREHHLTEHETKLLFGLIFFSRMYDSEFCRIGTDYKMKSFLSCFDKTYYDETWERVEQTGLFYYTTDWVYTGFHTKDDVAYRFVVTIDNNKLNLSELAKKIVPCFKTKYCVRCESEFIPNSNSQKMCPECKKIVTRENKRIWQQNKRALDKG